MVRFSSLLLHPEVQSRLSQQIAPHPFCSYILGGPESNIKKPYVGVLQGLVFFMQAELFLSQKPFSCSQLCEKYSHLQSQRPAFQPDPGSG